MIWSLMNIQSIVASCRAVCTKHLDDEDWKFVNSELSWIEKELGPLAREIDDFIRKVRE